MAKKDETKTNKNQEEVLIQSLTKSLNLETVKTKPLQTKETLKK